ncbi:MAG: hypothetical protein LC775_10230 [Acidobacteria bacterium]|nr:hypothetical protein [Acidobacteriota bacterium]
MCAPRPSAKQPWRLRDRFDERDLAELINAYREGATATSLTAAHGVSLKSVKRLLHIAGVRRTSTHATSYKANAGRDASVGAEAPTFTARTPVSATPHQPLRSMIVA